MTPDQQLLLHSYLKTLKLPTFAREYEAVARQCAQDNALYPAFLQQLAELEVPMVLALNMWDEARDLHIKIDHQRLAELAGIRVAAVQLGANLACAGSPDGLGWEHTLTHPVTGAELARLFLENCGLATASILDQAYSYRSVSYYNHLNPQTGYLADSLLSVTVVAPSTELAAALARGIFPLGPVKGIQLLDELPGVDGLLLERGGRVLVSDSLFIWTGG